MTKIRSLALVLAVLLGLQAFSWAQTTYLPGGGLVLLAEKAGTAATVDFYDLPPYAYLELQIVFAVPAADEQIIFRTDFDNGASFDVGGTDYSFVNVGQRVDGAGGIAAVNFGDNSSTAQILNMSSTVLSGAMFSGTGRIYQGSATSTAWHQFIAQYVTTGNWVGGTSYGRRATNGFVNAIRVATIGSNNMTYSIRLWGKS